jgi:transcriptional regulator with XRE-family HTH domain
MSTVEQSQDVSTISDIRLARERAGLSKRRLAEASGVARATITAYEAKAHPELTPTFVRIATAIDAARYGNGGDSLAALETRLDGIEELWKALAALVTQLVEARIAEMQGTT